MNTTITCPSWCTVGEEAHAAELQRPDWVEGDVRSHQVVKTGNGWAIEITQYEDEAQPEVFVSMSEGLTDVEDARQLAAALVKAADLLDT